MTNALTDQCLLLREQPGCYRLATAEEIREASLRHLAAQMRGTECLNTPQTVRDFLALKLGTLEHEVFAVIHLNAHMRLVEYVEMFRGTLTHTSVHPREIVKEALAHNSAFVILVHNHPSGSTEPSEADKLLTTSLKTALAMVEVSVVDHMIVGGSCVTSFAERGLI